MNETIQRITATLDANEIPEESAARNIINEINIDFPADYIEYMLSKNGGEGSIGKEGYIRFWMLQELLEANEDYAVQKFAPGLFLIGTDGGDTAYGVRKEDMAFIEVPFIGMADEEAKVLGRNFAEFLQAINDSL